MSVVLTFSVHICYHILSTTSNYDLFHFFCAGSHCQGRLIIDFVECKSKRIQPFHLGAIGCTNWYCYFYIFTALIDHSWSVLLFCSLLSFCKRQHSLFSLFILSVIAIPSYLRTIHFWRLALKIIQNQTFIWTKLNLSHLPIGPQQYSKLVRSFQTTILQLGTLIDALSGLMCFSV